MTKPYAEVIGDPVAHSKSPTIHRFWLKRLGIEGDYAATRVTAENLAAFFESRRSSPDWRGCNVTLPHKQAVIPLLDRLTPMAAAVGAVNLISVAEDGLVGGNSDVDGICNALPTVAPGALERACLIGSGGAALAALAAFRAMGVQHLFLNVRNLAKGQALLALSGMRGRVGPVDDSANLKEAQLIVNASTLGMAGQAAMPEGTLSAVRTIPDDAAIVFDMVYAPLETALLAAARGRGLRTVDGLAMLVGQAAASFHLFFGCPAPRVHDAELRLSLTS